MAQCVLCGKSGWLVFTKHGMCNACWPGVVAKATALFKTVGETEKRIKRLKTLDSRVEYYERMAIELRQFVEWEHKGVRMALTDAETGAVVGTTFAHLLYKSSKAWDDDIVEELEAEAKDAEQRAAAAVTQKKRARPLEGALERVRYFRQKMRDPARLDSVETRLALALSGQPCRVCGQPVAGRDGPCPGCGAAKVGLTNSAASNEVKNEFGAADSAESAEEPPTTCTVDPAAAPHGPLPTGPWKAVSCGGACGKGKSGTERMTLDVEGPAPLLRCVVCGWTDDPAKHTDAGCFKVLGIVGGLGVAVGTLLIAVLLFGLGSWSTAILSVLFGGVGLLFGLLSLGVVSDASRCKQALDEALKMRTVGAVVGGTACVIDADVTSSYAHEQGGSQVGAITTEPLAWGLLASTVPRDSQVGASGDAQWRPVMGVEQRLAAPSELEAQSTPTSLQNAPQLSGPTSFAVMQCGDLAPDCDGQRSLTDPDSAHDDPAMRDLPTGIGGTADASPHSKEEGPPERATDFLKSVARVLNSEMAPEDWEGTKRPRKELCYYREYDDAGARGGSGTRVSCIVRFDGPQWRPLLVGLRVTAINTGNRDLLRAAFDERLAKGLLPTATKVTLEGPVTVWALVPISWERPEAPTTGLLDHVSSVFRKMRDELVPLVDAAAAKPGDQA